MLDWGAEGILGGHDFFLHGFGGARFLRKMFWGHDFSFTIAIQKKLYLIFHLSLLWYHLLSMRIFHFVSRLPDSPVF